MNPKGGVFRQSGSIFCPTDDLCERGTYDDWCDVFREHLLRELEHRALLVTPPKDPLATPVVGPCWVVGSRGTKGYQQISIGSRVRRVHRVSTAAAGHLIGGMTVDHLCRNRACCNPAHLEVTTNAVNIMRGDSPSARHAAQTHCKRGHDLTDPANVRVYGGRRHCKTCRAIAARSAR